MDIFQNRILTQVFTKKLKFTAYFFAILESFLNQSISGASVKPVLSIEHKMFQKV